MKTGEIYYVLHNNVPRFEYAQFIITNIQESPNGQNDCDTVLITLHSHHLSKKFPKTLRFKFDRLIHKTLTGNIDCDLDQISIKDGTYTLFKTKEDALSYHLWEIFAAHEDKSYHHKESYFQQMILKFPEEYLRFLSKY